VKFPGTSGYDHLFDFVIPKSRKQPERIIQSITRPTKETAFQFIYAWTDTRQVRSSESKAYAILNDTEQPVSGGVMEAFRNYEIQPVPFSQRVEAVMQLAA